MKAKSVCIFLENTKGQILLLLRDNIPSIKYPNQWVILGGVVEENESPKEAIKREMMEEIGIDLGSFELLQKYDWPEKEEYVYHKVLNLDPKNIDLTEGQKIEFFEVDKIKNMDLAFHDNQLVKDFIDKKK